MGAAYKRQKTCYLAYLFTVIIVLLLLPFRVKASSVPVPKEQKILFLSSYSYSWDAVQDQIKGIQEVVKDEYFLDFEFMEGIKMQGEEGRQIFYDSISYRISHLERYDLIITGDDLALAFVLDYRKELFEGIPVVFEGVNDQKLVERASKDPLITGICEKTNIQENIELGLKISPKANKVVGIIDDTLIGQTEREEFDKCSALYPNLQFEIINSSKLTEKELISELRVLRQEDIVIYVAMSDSLSGVSYTDQDAIDLIVDNCPAPVLRVIDTGMEQGLFGGYVVPMVDSGKKAAQMGVGILKGKDVSFYPIQNSPYKYVINEEKMKQYGISKKVFPKETEYYNHTETFYERHQIVIKRVIPVIIVFIGFIVWFGYDNIKMKKMMKELKEARKIMEDASHHDFLTGLPNRSKFVEDLQEIIGNRQPCTVIMLDIDDFKHINDTMGHGAGDEALKEIARRMKAMQTNILTPYRYAGDEFIMILRSEQHNIVEKTAYTSRQIFADKVMLSGEKRVVTGSIGVASYPKDACDMDQLIVCADEAMYEVKKSGKNKFAYYKGPRKESLTE